MLREHFLEIFEPFPGDESFVICKICPNSATFENMNIYDISRHVKSSHNDVWMEWIETGIIVDPDDRASIFPCIPATELSSNSDSLEKDDEASSEAEDKVDEDKEKTANEYAAVDAMIVKFFSTAGISLDMVQDRSFTQLIYALNKKYATMMPCDLARVRKKMAWNSRSKLKAYRKNDPLTLTVDLYKNRTEIFLAFSIHYFDDNFVRMNHVFMMKLRSTEFNSDEIIQEIKFTIHKVGCQNSKFYNLVATNSFNEKSILKSGDIPNGFICYYSYISNFVEQIIRLEAIVMATADMRNFIATVRGNRELYSALEAYFKKKRMHFLLPDIESGKWILTTTFIKKCVKLHPHFLKCVEFHKWKSYVSEACIERLKAANEILDIATDSVTQLSKENGTISMIIPEVIYMKRFLNRDVSHNSFAAEIFTHFNRTLNPLLRRYRGGSYEFATFLDPRYALSDNIFSPSKWSEIETSLLDNMFEKNFDNKFISKPEQFAKTIAQEVEIYKRMVLDSRPLLSEHPFEWWNIHGVSLNYLSMKARDLLSVPPCAVDADQYFGKFGRFTCLSGQTHCDELNRVLKVAALSEKYRGRGTQTRFYDKSEPITKAMVAKYVIQSNLYSNSLNSSKRIDNESPVPVEPEISKTSYNLEDMINQQQEISQNQDIVFNQGEVKQEIIDDDYFNCEEIIIKEEPIEVKTEVEDVCHFSDTKEEIIDFSDDPSTSALHPKNPEPTGISYRWNESDDFRNYKAEVPTVIRKNMPINIRCSTIRDHLKSGGANIIKGQVFQKVTGDSHEIRKVVIRQPLKNDAMKSAMARLKRVNGSYEAPSTKQTSVKMRKITGDKIRKTVKAREANSTR